MKLRSLATAIILLTSFPAITYAGNYRFDEIYEIAVPDDWRVLSSSHSAELMKSATDIVKKTNIEIDLKNLTTPFIIYKEKSNEVLLTRVMIAPPELTKEEFDNLTALEINKIGEELSKRQNEIIRASGVRLISSQFGTGNFKGTPAVRTESISYNSKGFKVSRAQYIIYRKSATLIISLEHTILSGEPSYRLIENQISSFNVLSP